MHQNYPKDKMEWIIIDDGTDKIKDLVEGIPQVKYYEYDTKMPLGKKRNIMHDKSKGDIIVYMDDDDYYPPERVSHAVNMLMTHPSALCAGASEIYIWFKHIQKMFQFGPYGPNHATAGTFAFKRELLKDHRYEDHAALAEEKAFLKNYSVPFVQLEPKKTILVFSHIHNTFDKKKLLEQGENDYQKTSPRTVDEFVKDATMRHFYMEKILFLNLYPDLIE
jgi:glycosyltransferase involved in cell wall biosynthesis